MEEQSRPLARVAVTQHVCVALRARTQTHTETPRPKRTTCDVHPPWIKSRATDGPGALPAPGLRKTATVVPQQRLAITALLLSDLQGQLARQAAGADPYTRPGLRIGPSVRRTERQGCASWWPRALREPGPHCAAQHTHAGPCKRDYDRRAAPATTTLPPIRGRRAAAVTACHPDPPAARAPALCRTAHRRSLLLLLLQLRRRRRLLLLWTWFNHQMGTKAGGTSCWARRLRCDAYTSASCSNQYQSTWYIDHSHT